MAVCNGRRVGSAEAVGERFDTHYISHLRDSRVSKPQLSNDAIEQTVFEDTRRAGVEGETWGETE